MRSITSLLAVAALVIPATAMIDGGIKNVDWSNDISGVCPPIDYKPMITISNTGDEKARFYMTMSVSDERGKERQTGCFATHEIEPGESASVRPYPIKLMSKYDAITVTLYANSCLEDNILDIDVRTFEFKSCLK
jgi:hypothetical protein